MSLNGTWYSSVGSKLQIDERDGLLTGDFDSVENPSGGKFKLHGSIDPDSSLPNRALSFSVCWIAEKTPPEFRSVSSYTGQYHKLTGREVIEVIFLLADETTPARRWASVYIGHDRFTRQQPSGEEIAREQTTRRPTHNIQPLGTA